MVRTAHPTANHLFLSDLIVIRWRAGRMRKRGSMSFRCLGFCRVRRGTMVDHQPARREATSMCLGGVHAGRLLPWLGSPEEG